MRKLFISDLDHPMKMAAIYSKAKVSQGSIHGLVVIQGVKFMILGHYSKEQISFQMLKLILFVGI